MSSDSSYITIHSSSIDFENAKAAQIACQEIVAANRFVFLQKIGSGSYGDVFKVKDKERNTILALKVILSEDKSQEEDYFWPRLQHSNIVPLLEAIKYPSSQTYLMPIVKTSMYNVMYVSNFRHSAGCWRKLKRWLYQILSGLEYMHGEGVCHLDLKEDNVLISEKEVAMLCDFSCVKSTMQIIKKGDFGLPSIYRPPESRPFLHADQMKTDGVAFDQWSFGMMVLELLADTPISDKVNTINVCSKDENPSPYDLWFKDLFPVLMRETREKIFKSSVRKCFPKVKVSAEECKRALDFIMVFLQPFPSHRWSAWRGKRHAFLGKGCLRIGKPLQEVWPKTIRKICQYYNTGVRFV